MLLSTASDALLKTPHQKMSCVIVLVSLNLGFIFPCFYSLSYIVSKTNTKEEAKNELKVKLSLF